MSSPFALNRGITQQRIASASAPDGSYLFELGDSSNGDARLAAGDYHEVDQDIVIPPEIYLIRPTVKLRLRDDLPAGRSWLLRAFLNGTEVYARTFTIKPPTSRTLTDIAIPLNDANGAPSTDNIAFRLELA